LAIALTNAAVNFVEQQVEKRPELRATAKELRNQVAALESQLLDIARGTGSCSTQELRIQANSLVLRATQSALVAAKGTGFVAGHPVGRWCQEAMFFLVWSCPQPVLEANLCELVGVEI
jgi:alkylation response protein AidB-like acyl-CoA dehydrogenase